MVEIKNKSGFLRELFHEAAEQQLSEASDNVARVCVRPPFALQEAEFLLACTRCAACLHACSYHALHLLPVRCGFLRSGTPAMELSKQSCHLCKDWPCVAACETGALSMPAANDLPTLGMMSVRTELCQSSLSNSCNECFENCPIPEAMSRDENGKPVINRAECPGCAMCLHACVADPKAIEVHYVV